MTEHTHISHKKRKTRFNHSELSIIELDCNQLFCGPASGRSQVLSPFHIPPKLSLWFPWKQSHWNHTSDFTLLLRVKTKEAHSRIQAISFPLIFLILYVGKARRWFFFPLSSKHLGRIASCTRIVPRSPPPKLSLHLSTEDHPKSWEAFCLYSTYLNNTGNIDDCNPAGRI